MATQQDFNEALLKLAILMYRIDGKIRLNEQELLDEIGDNLDWQGVNSITAVQNQALADVRQAISSNQVEGYLTNLKPALQFNKQQALDTARELMLSDGEEAKQERQLYDQLLHLLMAD